MKDSHSTPSDRFNWVSLPKDLCISPAYLCLVMEGCLQHHQTGSDQDWLPTKRKLHIPVCNALIFVTTTYKANWSCISNRDLLLLHSQIHSGGASCFPLYRSRCWYMKYRVARGNLFKAHWLQLSWRGVTVIWYSGDLGSRAPAQIPNQQWFWDCIRIRALVRGYANTRLDFVCTMIKARVRRNVPVCMYYHQLLYSLRVFLHQKATF